MYQESDLVFSDREFGKLGPQVPAGTYSRFMQHLVSEDDADTKDELSKHPGRQPGWELKVGSQSLESPEFISTFPDLVV